jgi:glucan phosphoethanolaminetransferase (alkaline phosphatase superfamily)
MPRRIALSGLALDVLAWHALPAVFLFLYVSGNFLAADAVVPHLRVVWLALLPLAVLRLGVALSGLRARAARVASSLAASLLLALMLSYYVLVLIGLHSWGRVVSWDLVVSYGAQFSRLADALDLSLPVAIGVPVLVYIGLFIAAWVYLGYFDWTPHLRRAVSTPLFAFIAFAASMVWTIEFYSFAAAPPTQYSEPVSLTFYPNEEAWDVQGHAVDRVTAASLGAAEEAARRAYVAASSAKRKNVILIVVDALRADHMGVYGYRRDTTPNLTRLENAGMLRKAASVHAACASSFCGLLSISTSRFLHQLSERAITLPEVLKRHGYRIHMVLSGNHALFYGLRKAYGEVDSYFDANERRSLEYMNDDRLVLERLAGFPSWDGEPVMIQLHLMSAHPMGSRDRALAMYAPAANYAVLVNRKSGPGGEPGEQAINYYDNGVLQADAVIAGILEALGRKGYLKNTVVAITADHGEALGEHGLFQHANSVREEVLRIPFVLLSYGYRPTDAIDGHAHASQVDIAPTLLAELGMPLPRSWKGTPLQTSVSRDFLYFQELWEAGLYDVRDARNFWKYWTNLKTGEEYAFNLGVDPGERLNAIDTVPPEKRRAWRAQLLAEGPLHVKGRPDQEPVKR